jgi:type IV pilus assembly protein PilA
MLLAQCWRRQQERIGAAMANRRSRQTGLTLIETMIVSIIVAVLAALLLPEMRSYQARTKVSEAILALSTCRNAITEVYVSGSDLPAADSWGCESERPSRFVERVRTTEEGIIRLTLGNEIGDLRLAIHDITLAPLNGAGNLMREADLGTPVRRWRCGSPADGTDVKADFLPASCRG